MSDTPQPPVLFERTEDDIGIIRLNRPSAYNAINQAVVDELGAILQRVACNACSASTTCTPHIHTGSNRACHAY